MFPLPENISAKQSHVQVLASALFPGCGRRQGPVRTVGAAAGPGPATAPGAGQAQAAPERGPGHAGAEGCVPRVRNTEVLVGVCRPAGGPGGFLDPVSHLSPPATRSFGEGSTRCLVCTRRHGLAPRDVGAACPNGGNSSVNAGKDPAGWLCL